MRGGKKKGEPVRGRRDRRDRRTTLRACGKGRATFQSDTGSQ
jgi:hypothetical protein